MSDCSLSVTHADIEGAARRLHGVARRTPVLTSSQIDEHLRAKLFFKCENFQRTGSFKFRGAYNALCALSETQRRQGVVAFSSGNHAQAVALAAKLLRIHATIVMPRDAPSIKLEATRRYGAEIVLYARGVEDREAVAARCVHERGATLISPCDDRNVIAGQGTAAMELIEEVGGLDLLFVPVGGGGLISGCSISAARQAPDCRVFGVEPLCGNDAQQSLRSGTIVRIPVPKTIADGAQTQHVGTLTFAIMQRLVADILTVTDDQLRSQMRFFAERMKIIAEPTGCLAAAAVMSKLVEVTGSRVGVIVSGGNVDMSRFCDGIGAAQVF